MLGKLSVPGRPTNLDYSRLVGCTGFSGPLRQYFSLYRTVSQRGRKRRERIEESKNIGPSPREGEEERKERGE